MPTAQCRVPVPTRTLHGGINWLLVIFVPANYGYRVLVPTRTLHGGISLSGSRCAAVFVFCFHVDVEFSGVVDVVVVGAVMLLLCACC